MAKPHLPIVFMGQIEEIDSLFPRVKGLDLIEDDK